MNFQRRVSLPLRPQDKQNKTPSHKSHSKNSFKLKLDLEKTIVDIKVVQIENFVDDSLLVHLPVSREHLQMPMLQQMPSVELQSVPGWILTPRDFDEFRREVQLQEERLYKYQDMKRYIKVDNPRRQPLPQVDWQRQKQLYKNQVIRHNCNNGEYQKFLMLNKRKMKEYIDDVFLPNDSAFKGMSKVGQTRHNLCPKTWKRFWITKHSEFPYNELQQGIYRTENLLSCFLALPILYQLNLFEGQNFEDKAAFFVKLHKEGTWRYIMIDNMLPYAERDINFLSGGFALTLLEKAWAKHLGSYSRLDTLEDVHLTEIISDLTGAPSEELKCSNPRILQQIKSMLAKKYILIASNQFNHEKQLKVEYRLGVPVGYSYPVERVEDDYVILRNVWGYESTSPFVGTEQIRLYHTQLKQFFETIVVNKIIENGHHNSITVRQKKGFYSLIQLVSKENAQVFITLSQIDKLTSLEEYSRCRVIVFQQTQDRVIYVQQAESYNKKTNMQMTLSKENSYLVLVEMHWIAKEYESTLSILSDKPVDLTTLKYNSQNDYLLTLKKQKTRSEKLSGPSTPNGKTSRSERFRQPK